MNFGYLTAPTIAALETSLAEAVARLEARAFRLAGIVPTSLPPSAADSPARRLRILPGRDVLPRGEAENAHGLSPATIDRINLGIGRELPGARGLVLHRFTEMEARGWGFAPAMAAAIDLGKPVLVGLEGAMTEGFLELAGASARRLASAAQAADWLAGVSAA